MLLLTVSPSSLRSSRSSFSFFFGFLLLLFFPPRFTPWNDIPAEHRKWALDLGYDVDGFEWNLVNDSAVEGFDYSTLIRDFETAGNEDAIDAMNNFGYDENVWDCWINHYSYFDWEEFVQYEFVEPLIVLGWNQSSWDGDAPEPESDSKDWIELTVEERAAAEELCYFEEVWDGTNPDILCSLN